MNKKPVLVLCVSLFLASSHAVLAEEDSYEREADNVADKVMGRPAPVTREAGNTSSSTMLNQSQQMQGTQQMQRNQGMQTAPTQQQMNQQQMQQQMR